MAILFITGGAGTGKTTKVNRAIKNYDGLILPTAMTGVAATHINGTTVHSAFHCKPIFDDENDSYVNIHGMRIEEGEGMFRQVKKKLRDAKLLIIDEVSMMSAEFFEDINFYAQAARENYDEPFGGLNVMMVGDFMQLAPISKNYKASWVFQSELWKEHVKVHYLTKVYRQEERDFKEALSKIRNGICDVSTRDLLQSRVNRDIENGVKPIKLFSRRDLAHQCNIVGLSSISGKAHTFRSTSDGDSKALISKLKEDCLAPDNLELKIGAQVMTLVNSPDSTYVNGSMGVVVEFKEKDEVTYPIIELKHSGKRVLIEPYTWKRKSAWKWASYTQFPLALAYGITIHKSQGMTLDSVEVDFNGMFAEGQAYVALSRARSLDGITIKNFDPYAIRANQEALNFYRSLE